MTIISIRGAIVFGMKNPPLPLRGFPPGRARIRQRNDAATVVTIRPPEGGARRFVVEAREGAWWPAWEIAANRCAEGKGTHT